MERDFATGEEAVAIYVRGGSGIDAMK